MNSVKVAMGFPMLATVVWLFNIASSHYGKNVLWLGIFLVVVALAAWVFGEFVQRGEISTSISFRSEFDTGEVSRWFLMPRGKEYRSFQIVRHETGKPGTGEVVTGLTEYLTDDPSLIAFKLASVKAGYTFEVAWFYK